MKILKKLLIALLAISIISYNSITSYSEETTSSEIDYHVTDSNDIPNWPKGPEIGAQTAVLMEANTGVILYAQGMHEHMYPASTTKMMTALLAAENSDMSENVEFSYDAVFSLEDGSSNIGIDPGESMSMEECLYGLMVASANEVANAVAEHVGGDRETFVSMMNDRASELGMEDTHFANANGLFDEEHYTSAYDLALLAREFFNNEYLAKIGNTASYHFKATATQPDDFYVKNKHKLISGEMQYTGIKGGKTGYTEAAGETLVTCAEQNGMVLICVVLNEESPAQFTDTMTLFDYGFSNFEVLNVADNEDRYSIENEYAFPTSVDILGSSKQILELDDNCTVIKPKNIDFDDMETLLSYEGNDEGEIVRINYSYHGVYLGYGSVRSVEGKVTSSAFDVEGVLDTVEEEETPETEEPVFINIVKVMTVFVAVGAFLILITFIQSVFANYNLLDNMKRRRSSKPKRRKEKDKLIF